MPDEYMVYCLHFPDMTHYTGITRNLDKRLREHNIDADSYVGRKLRAIQQVGRLVPEYKVGFLMPTNDPQDERWCKARAKRLCQICNE